MVDSVPEALNSISGSESPSSPVSSYNNSVFTLEDFNEKVPELPPLLQQSLLDQPSSSRDESLEKPLTAVLNHLYIQKGCTGQSVATLSSTHRFRTKYVTVVLYKPLKKEFKNMQFLMLEDLDHGFPSPSQTAVACWPHLVPFTEDKDLKATNGALTLLPGLLNPQTSEIITCYIRSCKWFEQNYS
ncbi:unnamed protein product [Thlaspi arvense]|uniref:Association with the SNF1 complex (ASC) domain-containing protein n=1 Tax=Thlaspi arvense TaxID=13288 RepID=A0AAU9SQZ3_THLAR|nr:unnamed protein product [Thlaspi arvense]